MNADYMEAFLYSPDNEEEMTTKQLHGKIGELNKKLLTCTPEQKDMFRRMYPKGVDSKTVVRALQQVDTTISKNNVGKAKTVELEIEEEPREFCTPMVTLSACRLPEWNFDYRADKFETELRNHLQYLKSRLYE